MDFDEGIEPPPPTPPRIAEEEVDFDEGVVPFSVLFRGIPPWDGVTDLLLFAIMVR
jgi:hypothetical protein